MKKLNFNTLISKSVFIFGFASFLFPVNNLLIATNTCSECKSFTYHFENDAARNVATTPPSLYTSLGTGNAASAGVVNYAGTDFTSKALKPYSVGQRNSTGIINLTAFPHKATDYSVTWKQYYDVTTEGYKTGVVLRGDSTKVGDGTTGYVQGLMNGYILLPFSNGLNGFEFRIYKSTTATSLSMLTNAYVSTLQSSPKKPMWFRASIEGTTTVKLTLEYSTDSITWSVGSSVTDSSNPFQIGATQLIWGLAVSRTDLYFDNITFNGLALDGINTTENSTTPTTDVEVIGLGGLGKHLRMNLPVTTSGTTTSREMIVYVPQNLPDNRPLLITCHGSGQGDAYQAEKAAYWMVADTAKFITVYPNGINKQWTTSGDTDINFISEIIEYMHQRYKIDKKRVYLSGFSMGSMFTYYAANRMSEKIAAFAPTMGYNFSATATSIRPVPILQIIGTTDEVFTDRTGHMAILNAWIARNGCNSSGVVTQPYPIGSTTSQAVKTRWVNPQSGIEVVLMTTPKGHWHSNDPQHIMSNLEVWNFCKSYSLDGLIITSESYLMESNAKVIKEECFDLLGKKLTNNLLPTNNLILVKQELENGKTIIKKVFYSNN